MTDQDFLEAVGPWALGAMDAEERAELEAFLAANGARPEIQSAIDRARQAAALLGESLDPVRPGDALWPAILRGLPQRAAPPSAVAARPARSPIPWLIAAAGIAAALLATSRATELQRGLGEAQTQLSSARSELETTQRKVGELATVRTAQVDAERRFGDCTRELEALAKRSPLPPGAISLLDATDLKLVALAPQPGKSGRAVALHSPKLARAVVLSASLEVVAGRSLQLWVIHPGKAPAPAGFLVAHSGLLSGELDPKLFALGKPAAFAVSREPEGGSASPTEVLLVGALGS